MLDLFGVGCRWEVSINCGKRSAAVAEAVAAVGVQHQPVGGMDETSLFKATVATTRSTLKALGTGDSSNQLLSSG